MDVFMCNTAVSSCYRHMYMHSHMYCMCLYQYNAQTRWYYVCFSSKWKLCVSKKLMLPILLCTLLNLLCSCAYAAKIHGLVDAERMIKNLSFMLTTAHVLGGTCSCTTILYVHHAIYILQLHMSNDAN